MNYTNSKIPPYLHWNNRLIYENKDFCYFHKLYRLKKQGNPITIEPAWVNAISCKWSKLIKKEDIIFEEEKIGIGDDYDFVFVKELRKYKNKAVLKEVHEYQGTHVISCIIKHSPKEFDYSHSEILIRHQAYKDNSSLPFFDETYSYESWNEKKAMLKKSNHSFFKDLKKDFRVDMIKLISRPSSENRFSKDILAFFTPF